MICVIYVDCIILVIILLIIFEMGIMSHVMIMVNINRIKIMIIIVVRSIFIFVRYYIISDVSVDNFKIIKLTFLGLMVLILSSINILMFLR